MEKGGYDAGAGASKGVAEGDGTSERVDVCILEAQNLRFSLAVEHKIMGIDVDIYIPSHWP